MRLNVIQEVGKSIGLIDGRNVLEKHNGRNLDDKLTCKHTAQNLDISST